MKGTESMKSTNFMNSMSSMGSMKNSAFMESSRTVVNKYVGDLIVQTMVNSSLEKIKGCDVKKDIEWALKEVFWKFQISLERKARIRNSLIFQELESAVYNKAPSWIPDSWAKECFCCNSTFNLSKRKHHCRNCGNIFCKKCLAKKSSIVKFAYLKPVPVCAACYKKISDEKQK